MILSVSRRTDIPAFYSEWFYNRIKEGYILVRNPMNFHQVSKIDITKEVVDCIVFWTKKPMNMLPRLNELKDYMYYYQFTVTPYNNSIEKGINSKRDILKAFIELAEKIGPKRVIWRYDPIIISEQFTVNYHIKCFEAMAKKLKGYTHRVIISFLDYYKKTEIKMKDISSRKPIDDELIKIVTKFKEIASNNNMQLFSCAEPDKLADYGILPGKCIDDELISNLIGVKVSASKHEHYRKGCGCMESHDIGVYNTCLNGCIYCYANYNENSVKNNNLKHDPNSPFLIGGSYKEDKLSSRSLKVYKNVDIQLNMFN